MTNLFELGQRVWYLPAEGIQIAGVIVDTTENVYTVRLMPWEVMYPVWAQVTTTDDLLMYRTEHFGEHEPPEYKLPEPFTIVLKHSC